MTAPDVYAALKFWLPMVTAFGLIIRAYHSAAGGITSWADKLLNNHLSHIQAGTERTATLLEQSQRELKMYQKEDSAVQRNIVTALEVLKDRM